MPRIKASVKTDQKQLRAVLVGPRGVGTQAVSRLTRAVVASAKMKAPVKTGLLRNSITAPATPTVSGMSVKSTVVATAPYAGFVHDGTRPHVIRPRNASVLRFPTRSGIVFAAHVNHPGTKARPFLRNAIEEQAPRMGFQVRSR